MCSAPGLLSCIEFEECPLRGLDEPLRRQNDPTVIIADRDEITHGDTERR